MSHLEELKAEAESTMLSKTVEDIQHSQLHTCLLSVLTAAYLIISTKVLQLLNKPEAQPLIHSMSKGHLRS